MFPSLALKGYSHSCINSCRNNTNRHQSNANTPRYPIKLWIMFFTKFEKLVFGTIPRHQGKPAAVLLRSYPDAGMFPEMITVPLKRKCKKVYLLGALAGETPKYDATGLKIAFVYGDGSERELPLHYNEEIGHIRGYSSAQLTAFDRISIGGGYFWSSGIVNPFPDKEVAAIRLTSVGIPYLVIGISGE